MIQERVMDINREPSPRDASPSENPRPAGAPGTEPGAERHFTPSTADNNSFETGAGVAGFDAPAIGSINLDNPEVDLGDDIAEADLDSRSSDEELED
jgi:hypothetical protein